MPVTPELLELEDEEELELLLDDDELLELDEELELELDDELDELLEDDELELEPVPPPQAVSNRARLARSKGCFIGPPGLNHCDGAERAGCAIL